MKKASAELLKALAVTSELTGTTLSEPAVRVMASDLAQFPEHQIVAALVRCRRELRSTLTLAAIIERIEDGRPGADEAWAMVKSALGDEGVTVVWTPEMKTAFFVASNLADDAIAARMAFLEKYRGELQRARSEGTELKWEICLGYSKNSRELPILDAIEKHRVTFAYAQRMLPVLETPDARIAQLAESTAKQLQLR